VELVVSIVKKIVDHPEAVTGKMSSDGITVELETTPEDRGRVIGRRGKTVDSLRILATAAFANPGGHVDIKIKE